MIKPLDIHLDTEAGLATDIPPEQACLRVTTETGALRSPSHSCVLPPSNLVSSAPCCVGRAACPRCESGAKSLSPRPLFGLGNAPALPSLLAKPVAFVLAAKLQTCVPLPTLLKPLGVGAPRMLKSNSIQRMANQVATGLITQKAKMPTTRECHVKSASLLTHMYVALLSVLMGATDGLSLGSIIFPHDDNHPNNEYRSLGMSLGLFTAFVCNFASCVTSQIPHAVGGAVMPIIPLMAAYFQTFGTENCATVMVAIPLITVCVGLLTIASGYFKTQELVKACPFAVFGGFIATMGVQLLQLSLNVAYGKFKTVTSLGPDGLGAFADLAFWKFAGAPALVACFVFLAPRILPDKSLSFLMPCSLFLLTLVFYLVMFLQGGSIDGAREEGWLFDVQTPSGFHFFEIWSMYNCQAVRWELIWSSHFVRATFQVYMLSLLTCVSNIYGTAEVTNCPIDIDKEICSAGMQTFCCGLAGGMPGNIVMSFSVTAHGLGARSKEFSWMLAVMSFCFFLFGDYIIAFLPRMVPACVLIWLGLVLVSYWIWDGVGKMSVSEHAVVIVMICVGIFADITYVLTLGIILTLGITMKRMMSVEVIREEFTLQDRRSDVLRSESNMKVLQESGHNIRALRIARGYLSFISASGFVDHVRRLRSLMASGEVAPFYVLLIDFEEVTLVDTTVLKALSELLSLGRTGGFHLLLVGCTAEVEAAIVCFDIQAQVLVSHNRQMHLDQMSLQGWQILECARRLAVDPDQHCNTLLLISCSISASQGRISPMSLALEFCETHLLERAASQLEDPIGWVRQLSVSKQCEIAAAAAGLEDGQVLLPLLYDIHSMLAGQYSEYDVTVLRELSAIFQVQQFGVGATIYSAHTAHREGHDVVPPLIWLFSGDVEHIWVGDSSFDTQFGTQFERIANACRVQHYQRLEKAALVSESCQCVGFFQTSVCFFAAMPHAGKLFAVLSSRCVLLRHQQYQDLRRENPKAAELLFVYLTRKRLVQFAMLASRPMLSL